MTSAMPISCSKVRDILSRDRSRLLRCDTGNKNAESASHSSHRDEAVDINTYIFDMLQASRDRR